MTSRDASWKGIPTRVPGEEGLRDVSIMMSHLRVGANRQTH